MMQAANARAILTLSQGDRFLRFLVVGMCVAPLIGSYFYNLGFRIPFLVCPLRHFTGIPCPGCGMTRSFMAIADGDLGHAIAEHLFGPLLFFGFAIAVTHSAWELLQNRHFTTFYTQLLADRRWQIGMAVLLGVYHVWRLQHMANSGELQLAFEQSPMGEWLANANGRVY